MTAIHNSGIKRKNHELLPDEPLLKRESFPRIDMGFFHEVLARQNHDFVISHTLDFKKHKWAALRRQIIDGQSYIIFSEAPLFRNLTKLIERSLLVLRLAPKNRVPSSEKTQEISLDITALINEQNLESMQNLFPNLKKTENCWILSCSQKNTESRPFFINSNYFLPGVDDESLSIYKADKDFKEELFLHITQYLKVRNLEIDDSGSLPDNYVDISAIVNDDTKGFLCIKYPLKKVGVRWFLPCSEGGKNSALLHTSPTIKSPEGYYILPRFRSFTEYNSRISLELIGKILSFLPHSDIMKIVDLTRFPLIAKQLHRQMDSIAYVEIQKALLMHRPNTLLSFHENSGIIRTHVEILDLETSSLFPEAIEQLKTYFPNIKSMILRETGVPANSYLQNIFRGWPGIKNLDLTICPTLPDTAFEKFSHTSLEELYISSPFITGINFDMLPPSLKTLSVEYEYLEITAFEKLKMLKKLEVLEITPSIEIQRATSGHVFSELPPSLKAINCTNYELFSEDTKILERFEKLEELELAYIHFERDNTYKFPSTLKKLNCGFIAHHYGEEAAEEAILRLENCEKLEELIICQSDIIGTHFDKLPRSLKKFNCTNCLNLADDAFLKLVMRCPNLEELYIGNTQITGEHFALLPQGIQVLDLTGCPLIESCIEPLRHLPLELLNVTETPIEDTIANSLAPTLKFLNGQRIETPPHPSE